tara:strand:+ start:85 stop:489 length:405 start_codon:yes stop_codon:yes gene_type:complete
MGLINNISDIGQMGSAHIKAAATDLKPPHGRVIVAIQVLNAAVKFDQLVADTSFASAKVDTAGTLGDGIEYFGTATPTRAQGLDQADDTAEAVAVATDVEFPAGITVYGRWTRVSLQANSTHGIICYYGPAHKQ